VWWGVLFIALGVFYLMQQLGPFGLPDMSDLWPVFVIGFGVFSLATRRSARGIAQGITFVLTGFWFLANTLHWWNAGWRQTWPMLLVIWGLGSIVRALLERRTHPRAGGET
jgi:hypothetical protein